MRWSSARIAWSVLVGLGLFVLLLCSLSESVHLIPERGSLEASKWYVLAAGRIFIHYFSTVAVLLVLAVGLATGLLPGGSWPELQESGAARTRVVRGFGWTFAIAVAFGLLLATSPKPRPGIDLRPPMVAAFELCVMAGAVLIWINLGAHRGAAIGTLVIHAALGLAQARWAPWWKRFNFDTLVGPWLLVHMVFVTLCWTAPLAFLMLLTAELRLAPAFRFTPGLAVVLVSGMFVLSGYLTIFQPVHKSPWSRSMRVPGHR